MEVETRLDNGLDMCDDEGNMMRVSNDTEIANLVVPLAEITKFERKGGSGGKDNESCLRHGERKLSL